MTLLVTLWWLSFWTAVGLCIGSFLNVIIHRLPRNQSIRRPRWSACPHCRHRIQWFDNLPVISFIWLRGHCRNCGAVISTRYIVVELTMALVVLMLLDIFCIGEVRAGLSRSTFGLTERLAYDWPILIAHITLFACLFSMSAIDLEHYWVDIRFTNLATLVGFAGHMLWTPAHSVRWPRPLDATSLASLLALGGLGVTWVLLRCQPEEDPEDFGEPAQNEIQGPETTQAVRRVPPPLLTPSRIPAWLVGVVFVAFFIALLMVDGYKYPLLYSAREAIPLFALFGLILWNSSMVRESDQQIMEAIEEERATARQVVSMELLLLLPAALFAAFGIWAVFASSDLPNQLHSAFHDRIQLGGLSLFRNCSPAMGLATAASGYIIGGAVGWAVRIVFTLAFGKEAFGTGDIHLMAAAGCVAGWPVAVLGFFLACLLAMIGWIASLPIKQSRAIPFGPWLSLAFLIVVAFYDRIVTDWPIIGRAVQTLKLLIFGNSQV